MWGRMNSRSYHQQRIVTLLMLLSLVSAGSTTGPGRNLSNQSRRRRTLLASKSFKTLRIDQQAAILDRHPVPPGGHILLQTAPSVLASFDAPLEGDEEELFLDHEVVAPPLPHHGYPSATDHVHQTDHHHQTLHLSPQTTVIYQYFGRSRSRLRNHDSIPFLLLGPSADDWKTVGQTLASRGFSVMACEAPDDVQVISSILEALRWNRAIVVGCGDVHASLAVRAAHELGPERVAGLVVCGTTFSDHISVPMPYTIITDGTFEVEDEEDDRHACLIRGGGAAPHRRLPQQFAWALTRFVEEQVAPLLSSSSPKPSAQRREWRLPFLNRLPTSWVVTGRVLAETIFYISALRVAMYQYENIYEGLVRVQTGYKALQLLPKRILAVVGQAFWLLGSFKTNNNNGVLDTTAVAPDGLGNFPSSGPEQGPISIPPFEVEKKQEEEELLPEQSDHESGGHWPVPLLNPIVV